MAHHLLGRILVVVLASVGTTTGVLAVPAAAETCSAAAGVSVVVDFTGNPDGGGATSACDPGGAGDSARNVFNRHYSLQDHPQERGYVCRIDGRPVSGECQGTDSYWGLFHSDGRDGTWTYASTGVDGLSVPAGGSVAFAWQNGGGIDQPRVAPPVHRAEPSPTAEPTASSPSATSSPTTSPSTASPTSSPEVATGEDTRTQRLRRRADREARADARAAQRRAARIEAREELRRAAAAEARAERRREAREERRRDREGVETAPAQAAPDDAPATSDAAGDSGAGQVPTWLTVLVLLGMALLAALLAVLRRRAARAG